MSLTRMSSALSWFRKWLGGEPRMCLNTSQDVNPTPLIESGWKVFGGPNDAPNFEVQSLNGAMAVPLNVWLTADTGHKIKANDGRNYSSGFHVYTTGEKKKSSWRRVYFRRTHASGEQDGHPVVIARELFVPSNPDAWPPLEGAA